MSKRRGLGRGLGALIPADSTQDSVAGGVRTVPVTIIVPNPHQPRGRMDAEKLEELAASIKAHGLIQPLIVTERPGRWRASQLAGLTEVPVVVKETTPQEMLELAIIENIQRADLNAIEEAVSFRQLMDRFGHTQEQLAEVMVYLNSASKLRKSLFSAVKNETRQQTAIS